MNQVFIIKLAILLIALNTLPLNAQWVKIQEKYNFKNTEKKFKMRKKFDIERFNKHMNMGEYTFNLDNGMIIRQVGDCNRTEQKVEGYREYCSYPNSPYEYYYEYDSKGNIVKSITSFYSIYIGLFREYDKQGNSRVTEDFEAPYKGSIDDLKDKMKREYNIDITDMEKTLNVKRWVEDDGEAFYEVRVRVPNSRDWDAYLIDANTGKTLVTRRVKFKIDDIFNRSPKEETMEEEYRRVRKEQEEKQKKEEERKKKEEKANKPGFWESLFE